MRCLTIDECMQWRSEYSRRHGWKRQLTCVTPLKQLSWFTSTLVSHLLPFEQALLIVDQVVFSVPPALEAIRHQCGEHRPVHEAPGHLFEHDPEGFRAALEAALSGWIDLRVIFSPSRHAVVADHDEYTTFFSESAGKIAEVRSVLERGHVRVVDYVAAAP